MKVLQLIYFRPGSNVRPFACEANVITAKGQLISKGFFVFSNSSKNKKERKNSAPVG